MAKLLKVVFGLGAAVGFFVLACAASTIDHAGSIPVTDGQLMIAAIIGAGMMLAGVLGLKSMEVER